MNREKKVALPIQANRRKWHQSIYSVDKSICHLIGSFHNVREFLSTRRARSTPLVEQIGASTSATPSETSPIFEAVG